MHLGKTIQSIRKSRGLTQADLAKAIKRSQVYISKMENGDFQPSLKIISQISDIIKVPVPVLMWAALEEKDVHADKVNAYLQIRDSVNQMINEAFQI